MTLGDVLHPAQPCAGDDYKTSLGQAFSVGDWRLQVERLSRLGAPLLAVGTDKAPIHLVTGKHLSKWQGAAFTAGQIAESAPAIGCGVRTGNGLLVFDVDGVTALEWLLDHGCDPRAVKTWQIHRDTDENRFKVAFTITAEQQHQFGNAKPKQHTKDAVKDGAGNVIEKGEAVEVFHSTGGQVVVLGQHHDSGGNYYWPDGLEVENLAPIPPEWWEAATRINGATSAKVSATKAGSSSKDWKSLNPCPICGRNTTGYCSQHSDGKTIRCFQGVTFAPPQGLQRGDRITDSGGQQWGFSQEQTGPNGDVFSVFVEHEENSKTAKGVPPRPSERETSAAPVTFEDRWQELEEHAAVVACSDWPVMKAVASLASKAGDLEVNRLTGRNLEQLLEQAHRAVRAKAEPITGGGTFKVKATPWAVDGLFRHGLNLLVGQSGAGKSRLAAACMAAWLRGDQTWLNLPLNGIEPKNRHALIVGSDQTLEDWAITLEPVGLCKRLDGETVRIHPNLTLYGLETAVGLDADGLAIIRRWVDHNPGGMVLVDSLSSCLPPGIDEATKAAGRPVRQLQEVLGDAWGILTHHTRKGAGKEGNLGVGAGRGSGDIDAAVSRVIGLGLIYKMENGVLVPQESDERRELLSTKRGGKTLHLVVRSDASGFWSNEGDAEALKQQERQERAISNLTEAQGDVLALLDAADGWMTLRALMEGAGEEYEAKGAKAATTRKVLKRLEVLGDAWGILTHHTRTGAGTEGTLGVGAGRGSGDIDAADSRVIGLGLIYKMENGLLVPQESDDRRELLSTKRGGKTLHLVVKSDASGFWSNEGDAEALKQQERQARAISNLTEAQGDVLALLDAADGWMTLRALIEGAGEEYDAKSTKVATTRKVLKRLEVLGLAESVKSGHERTYRAKGEPVRGEERELSGFIGSSVAPQGVSLALPLALGGSSTPKEPPVKGAPSKEPQEPLAPPQEPQGEPVKTQSLQRKSQVSHLPPLVAHPTGSPPTPPNWPAWGDQLLQLRAEHPKLIPAQLVNLLQAEHGITTTGRAVAQLLQEVA